MGMRPAHFINSLLAIAVSAMLLAACGGGDDGNDASASTKSASSQSGSSTSSSAVTISDFKFQPATITVAGGTGVTVTNDDSTAHTATADDGNSFDTGTVDPGSSGTISVKKPGSYPYHCDIHPFMHGKLVVK